MAMKVLDVSQWNGSIDWSKVSKEVDAVIIRVGYRGYGAAGTMKADPKFKTNIAAAIKAGLPVGVYWCTQALSDAEAKAEAAFVKQQLSGFKLTYPVYLDSEHCGPNASGRADKISKARRTQYGLTFCKALKDYGFKPGLYCSESWYTDEIDGQAFKKAGYGIWIAKYSKNKPKVSGYDGWQYTDAAAVSGISGKVDLSHFYTDYAVSGYRAAVQKRFGFDDNTMKFLDGHSYPETLYKKLATMK